VGVDMEIGNEFHILLIAKIRIEQKVKYREYPSV